MKLSKKVKVIGITSIVICLVLTVWISISIRALNHEYESRRSPIILDRTGSVLAIKTNPLGYYAIYKPAPEYLKKLIVKNEDRLFYYHPGINPRSVVRAVWRKITGDKNPASSTITQQLAKILLQNENKRTVWNKLKETFVTFELELAYSKDEILNRYANLIFLGNRVQGVEAASQLYFGKSAEALYIGEAAELLATITNPSASHPFSERNLENAKITAERLGLEDAVFTQATLANVEARKRSFSEFVASDNSFEVGTLEPNCNGECRLFLDSKLNTTLRDILNRRLAALDGKNVTAGAIVVIKLPENELLAMVGTPNPRNSDHGHQLNMALAPRAIGSTVKPFIYAKAFEKGLRPYSLVDDREYRYEIANGFPLYPKNFDREYHGRLSIHYALNNSLNVPTVKALEYLGLEEFSKFLESDLAFKPVQPLSKYSLGIALGELEMSLLQLSHYMTLFPNNGEIVPLKEAPEQAVLHTFFATGTVIGAPYVQLTNKILSDRATGVDEFGLVSPLNLPWKNYAVKTGTSRDFHDSWTIGYTPDFLVGVWVGNSNESPMDGVSGIIGAGNIWNDTMSIVYNSEYNKNTPFNFADVKTYPTVDGVDYGLAGDDFNKSRDILLGDEILLSPHHNDGFLFEKTMRIPLKASESVVWTINGQKVGTGTQIYYQPPTPGSYTISAQAKSGKVESVMIVINPND